MQELKKNIAHGFFTGYRKKWDMRHFNLGIRMKVTVQWQDKCVKIGLPQGRFLGPLLIIIILIRDGGL